MPIQPQVRPAEADLRARLDRLTLEQRVRLLTGADFWALPAEPAVGLRRLVTSDGPAGVRGERWDERDTAANVPSPTALAATWDEPRIERLGRLLADEARRKGVDVLLAPTVNLHRTPYGGRHFECLSEDPLLTARIGAAYVRGVQAGGVAATVKHFVANDSETERFTVDAQVEEGVLRELYLWPFEVLVRDAGAWAVMAAYNAVNGTTMTEHPMLRDVLKDEWGFDGVVVSDWSAARSTEPAGRAALDLVMPGPSGPWGDRLVAAVREGRVPAEAVDDKVLRVLRLAARVGALDGVAPAVPPAPPWPPAEVAAELRATAAAGIVLARNAPVDGAALLPLDRAGLRRVAVLGPNAADARTLGGGSATVFPPYTVSPLEGLRAALGPDVRVDHSAGLRTAERVPVAAPDLLRLPDGGGPGVVVRFVDDTGEELGREQRTRGALQWMHQVLPDVPVAAIAAVEVTTQLVATEGGAYAVGAGGLGRLTIRVAGQPEHTEELGLPPGADPVEGMMRPPQTTVPVELRAGEPVEVTVRFEPTAVGGFGDAEVTMLMLQLVAGPVRDDAAEMERAVAHAAAADTAVVVVGTTEEVESEGYDRTSLALPGRQDELVRRVAAANPRTVVVVNAGAPVLLPWADEVPAVVLVWFPGQEAGNALADVLLGGVEPGGRLPVSWPATEEGLPSPQPVDGTLPYSEGLFVGYRAYDRAGRAPRYAFGHGMGYTTWDYVGADAPERVPAGVDVPVRVRLRNTGARAGREVVQVYAYEPGAAAAGRPERRLAGFAAAVADPGAEAVVEAVLPARAFERWDAATSRWATVPGAYELRVGRSSADLALRATTTVDAG